VLCATSARLAVSDALLEALRHDFSAFPLLWADLAYSPTHPRDHRARWARDFLQAPSEVVLADLLACNRFDVRDRLAEVRAPTLILSGTEDRLTPPRHAAELARCIPGARHVSLLRTGHDPIHEAPDPVLASVRSFLEAL
jgi:pimeloyl-ACP methyl ester carboxylesterase